MQENNNLEFKYKGIEIKTPVKDFEMFKVLMNAVLLQVKDDLENERVDTITGSTSHLATGE